MGSNKVRKVLPLTDNREPIMGNRLVLSPLPPLPTVNCLGNNSVLPPLPFLTVNRLSLTDNPPVVLIKLMPLTPSIKVNILFSLL